MYICIDEEQFFCYFGQFIYNHVHVYYVRYVLYQIPLHDQCVLLYGTCTCTLCTYTNYCKYVYCLISLLTDFNLIFSCYLGSIYLSKTHLIIGDYNIHYAWTPGCSLWLSCYWSGTFLPVLWSCFTGCSAITLWCPLLWNLSSQHAKVINCV